MAVFLSLSLSFLRWADTSDLDAKWMLLEAVAKHFFRFCARHVIQKLLTPFFLIQCEEDGGRKMTRVPFHFFFHLFLFCFWQNHYICLLYDDLCVFEYLKRDSDFLIALRASFKLLCAYLNCAFTSLQGGYCFSNTQAALSWCSFAALCAPI